MISSLVPGLVLHPEVVTQEEEKELTAFFCGEFSTSCEKAPDDRTVKQYGYRYDYEKKGLGEQVPRSLPLEGLADRFGVPEKDRQMIVNKYEPGQGISPHVDNPCFRETIWSLSLGSPVTMILQKGEQRLRFWLPRRSLLVLKEEAREEWKHSIEAVGYEDVLGEQVKRETRWSLTIRNVKK